MSNPMKPLFTIGISLRFADYPYAVFHRSSVVMGIFPTRDAAEDWIIRHGSR